MAQDIITLIKVWGVSVVRQQGTPPVDILRQRYPKREDQKGRPRGQTKGAYQGGRPRRQTTEAEQGGDLRRQTEEADQGGRPRR